MTASKGASRHSLASELQPSAAPASSPRAPGSDLERVDAHVIAPHEYAEVPELTDEMFTRGKVNKGGRPRSANPRKLVSIRLPVEVIERWRATGPGWQTRMVDRLSRMEPR
jgi:uncharacterized protein (DUF4415 family)